MVSTDRMTLAAALRASATPDRYAPGETAQAAALGVRPLPRITYRRLLELARLRFGDTHVVFAFPETDTVLRLGELASLSDRFARALLTAGLGPGDTIAVWSPPAPVWPVAMFGAASIGVRVCGLNTRYRREELRQTMSVLNPALVFTATGFLDIDAEALIAEATAAPQLTAPVGSLAGKLSGFLSSGDDVDPDAFAAAVGSVGPDTVALIQFTSGSTGAPKGVVISQAGSVAAAHYGAECVGLNSSDRLYSALPFFHIGGTISTALAAVASGCSAVLPQRFRADDALAGIADGCTAFHGHGALWRILLDQYRQTPIPMPTLRKGWASGDADFLRSLRDELDVPDLINMYGSSEAGTIACTLPGDPEDVRLGSLGHPTPGTEVSVRDDNGDPVPPGEVGELWLSGVMVMHGYLGESHDRPDRIATGDLVTWDGEVLRFAGRVDDRLKPGGENVSVVEVESFIRRQPGVEDVVVVGVPDRRLGEVPAAVVRSSNPTVTAESVVERCRAEIAGFKVPRHVRVVDDLPTVDTGKIDRGRIRTELLDHLRQEGSHR